ncbi:MAG: hypothetical protein KY464_01785, partial [Gemmatimonadetes bacterium]|nr:hypothetical protein [Gemmatimonadota bacterium]
MSMLSLEERTELLVNVAEFAANKQYDATLRLLANYSSEDLMAEPELGLRLALAHYHLCHLAEASRLVLELKHGCRRPGSDQLHRRLLQLEGTLLTEFGDLDRAEAAYLKVLNSATAAADQRLIAFSSVGLSATAGIRGEWIRAVALGKDAMTADRK